MLKTIALLLAIFFVSGVRAKEGDPELLFEPQQQLEEIEDQVWNEGIEIVEDSAFAEAQEREDLENGESELEAIWEDLGDLGDNSDGSGGFAEGSGGLDVEDEGSGGLEGSGSPDDEDESEESGDSEDEEEDEDESEGSGDLEDEEEENDGGDVDVPEDSQPDDEEPDNSNGQSVVYKKRAVDVDLFLRIPLHRRQRLPKIFSNWLQ